MGTGLFTVRMPVRFLRGHCGRLALTLVALASGVAAVVAHDLTGRSVVRAFEDVVDTIAGGADLQVSLSQGALFPKDVAIAAAKVPGVARVVPVLTATAFTTDGANELLTVHAFDLVDAAAAEVYGVHASAQPPAGAASVLRPGAVILTETFARRHRLVPGDRLDLDTPAGRQTFTVNRLIEAGGLADLDDGNLVVMDLYAAQAAFGRHGYINRVDVVVKPDQDPARVADAIRAVVPAGMQVEQPGYQKAVLQHTLASIRLLLDGFAVAGLLVAFLIAFNSLTTLFEGRAWQLGVLRAVGLQRSIVWRELVKEGVVLGALGVFLGIPLGIGYAYLLLPYVMQGAALNLNAVTPHAGLMIHASTLAVATALGLATALLAAALPAWRAAQVAIIETVRSRGVEQPSVTGGAGWWVRGGLASLMVVAVALEIAFRSGLWGLTAGALMVAATALAARPLVDLVGRVSVAGSGRLVTPTTRVAATQVMRNPRRAALMVAMIGVGIGSVLWLWMLAGSFERAVVDVMTQAIRADLVVSSAHLGSGFIEAPSPDELLAKLRAIRGVGGVVGVRIIEWSYGGGPIGIDSYDSAYLRSDEFGRWPLMGAQLPDVWETVARGDAVVASSNFLQNLHARVGDRITLATPDGPLTLQIAGVTTHFLSPRGTLVMSRETYARMWHDNQITRAYIRTGGGADAEAVRSTIVGALGRTYGLRVLRGPDLIEFFAGRVRSAFSAMDAHAAAMLLVVLVGIAETLAAGVAARTREFGAIRVVGAQRRHVRRMVCAEAVLLGALGLVLAAASGFAQADLWVQATFPYLFGFIFPLHVPYVRGGMLGLLTLGVCVIAAQLPARRAVRLTPAVAVRYE